MVFSLPSNPSFSWSEKKVYLYLYYVDGWYSCLTHSIFFNSSTEAILISWVLICPWVALCEAHTEDGIAEILLLEPLCGRRPISQLMCGCGHPHWNFSREDKCDFRDPGKGWERNTWHHNLTLACCFPLGSVLLQGCWLAYFLHPYLNCCDQKLCNYLSPGIVFNHHEFSESHECKRTRNAQRTDNCCL